jgi:hypothetical protein
MHRAAYAAGWDFRLESNRGWAVNGDVGWSRGRSANALIATQRCSNHYFQPDAGTGGGFVSVIAERVRRQFRSPSKRRALARFVGSAFTSPTYEVNDLGFAVRTDRRDLAAGLRISRIGQERCGGDGTSTRRSGERN